MPTIDEIRRANLLIQLSKHPSIAEFNAALGRKRNDPTVALIKNRQPNRGKPRVMGAKIARKIEESLGLPAGWMDEDHSEQPAEFKYIDDAGLFRVKTIALQGSVATMADPINLDKSIFRKYFPGAKAEDYAAAAVQDDSMAPTIKQGDRVLIETSNPGYSKDGCYCLLAAGRYLLRRLTMRLDGALMVSADGHPTETAQPLESYSGVQIVGRIVYLWTGRLM